jgi:hypothetical protein
MSAHTPIRDWPGDKVGWVIASTTTTTIGWQVTSYWYGPEYGVLGKGNVWGPLDTGQPAVFKTRKAAEWTARYFMSLNDRNRAVRLSDATSRVSV